MSQSAPEKDVRIKDKIQNCTSTGLRIKGFNTLRPRQDGRHFPDDTFKRIFLNENIRISIKISLKFAPKGSIKNNQALF